MLCNCLRHLTFFLPIYKSSNYKWYLCYYNLVLSSVGGSESGSVKEKLNVTKLYWMLTNPYPAGTDSY